MDDRPQIRPDLAVVLEELKAREPIFHRLELWKTREDFDRLMVEEYWEVGASGRIYDRAFVLEELERRQDYSTPPDWQTSGFKLLQLSENTYLLTYTLTQQTRVTRRSTLWRRTGDLWQILYHQGTVVLD